MSSALFAKPTSSPEREAYYKRLAYDILLRLLSHSDRRVIATGGSIGAESGCGCN